MEKKHINAAAAYYLQSLSLFIWSPSCYTGSLRGLCVGISSHSSLEMGASDCTNTDLNPDTKRNNVACLIVKQLGTTHMRGEAGYQAPDQKTAAQV